MRLYSRFWITRAPGIDDLLIVIAAGFGVALTVLVIIGNKKYRSGYHIWDIPPSTGEGHRLNVWISQWCYLYATGAIKISVLLFYRRLSVSFNRPFFWAVWAGIAYNIVTTLGFSIALLTICQPTAAYWLSFNLTWLAEHGGNRHCIYEGIPLTLSGVFSVMGDLYAALLPSLLIYRLQMPARQKWIVTLLFAVGYAVVGLGVGRTIALNRVVFHDWDYTWVLWAGWMWSVSELWVGLIAASAPSLKPLCTRFIVDPLTDAIHSATDKASRKHNTSYETESSVSKPRVAQPWTFLRNSHGKPTPTSTELSYASSKHSVTFHSQDVDWPMPPDPEKTAQSWYRAMPTPEMHNFRYNGGGRCWSEASSANDKRPLRSKSKRGSRQAAMHSSRSSHHRHDTADTALPQMTRDTSRASVRNVAEPTDQISPVDIGAAFTIDRTVEWSVLDERGLAEDTTSDGRILTRSLVDLEQRVDQFKS